MPLKLGCAYGWAAIQICIFCSLAMELPPHFQSQTFSIQPTLHSSPRLGWKWLVSLRSINAITNLNHFKHLPLNFTLTQHTRTFSGLKSMLNWEVQGKDIFKTLVYKHHILKYSKWRHKGTAKWHSIFRKPMARCNIQMSLICTQKKELNVSTIKLGMNWVQLEETKHRTD